MPLVPSPVSKKKKKKISVKLGVVDYACNPNIWEAETRGSRFEDSLSHLLRPSATYQDPVSNKE